MSTNRPPNQKDTLERKALQFILVVIKLLKQPAEVGSLYVFQQMNTIMVDSLLWTSNTCQLDVVLGLHGGLLALIGPVVEKIDIIEGVNKQSVDQSTLHTNDGCNMNNDNQDMYTGHMVNKNCLGNQGCGITASANSYGAPFNNGRGGVFVTEWTNNFIRMYYFPRNNIPADVSRGDPNPSGWGKPYAYFPLGSNCPASHFKDHTMVINLTFCGDWAGQVFNGQCPGMGSCSDYVKNNPQAFEEAYWLINYVAVYT